MIYAILLIAEIAFIAVKQVFTLHFAYPAGIVYGAVLLTIIMS
jgi:hypothetical protein